VPGSDHLPANGSYPGWNVPKTIDLRIVLGLSSRRLDGFQSRRAVNCLAPEYFGPREFSLVRSRRTFCKGVTMMRSVNKLAFQIKVLVPGVTALLLLIPALGASQRRSAPAEEESPVFREYRGVQLGMTTEDARKKLGSPKEKGDDQDFYLFGEKESAQIVYDKEHKVSTLSIDFLAGASDIPTARAVLGSELEAKADGSMHRMIRYPKAGYWVSYSRTTGDAPMISITIQKIN
jgi:hypothetical protein